MNRLNFAAKRIFLVIGAALLTGNALATEALISPSEFAAVKERLNEKGFTGVIAIASDKPGDETAYFAGFGDQAATSGKPNEETLVDTGSITKTITAAAALKLVDQGKLALSDRLSDFFPEAPADKAGITVHQLLTHSSGLPGAVAGDREGLQKNEFIARALAADLNFAPGSAYEYSNVGYSLIAAIIEHISGDDYETFIRKRLLKKTKTPSIGYEATFDPARSLMMSGDRDIAEGSWGGASNWALIGNGGLVTTAQDMITLRRRMIAGDIISSTAVELSQLPHQREGENAPGYYGYGMVVEDHAQFGRIYWHNGGNEEFLANWTHYADHGIVVFTASNSPTFDADLAGLVIAEKIFDIKIFPDE